MASGDLIGRVRAPVFLVGPPCSGDALLLDALGSASGVSVARPHGASFLDSVPGVDVGDRRRGHRLTAAEAPALADAAHASLAAMVVDREGGAGHEGTGTSVAAGARLGLRVPFLAAAFRDARFVLMVREPEAAIPEMALAWRRGEEPAGVELPGVGPWCLPLIPGWPALSGESLEAVVVEQWRAICEALVDDLDALPVDRWCVVEHIAMLADPRRELRRVCGFLGIGYDQALLGPLEAARRGLATAETRLTAPLERALPGAAGAAARVRELLAEREPGRPRAPRAALGSVSTHSFAQRLASLGGSLVVSTYQTGKLVCLSERRGRVNTHFRDVEKPMGLAVAPGRLSVGTRTEVWDLRNMPEAAHKLEPAGTFDACYLLRKRHVTGDIAVHDLTFAADGELWLVATAFSCLATLDADHSFVPRWKPPWISAIAPGDRCHLNGVEAVDGKIRYATALGRTDEPGGWRAGKATDGVLIDVPTSEVVVGGLSMPHSPRWHDGRLWVLQSGRGELCAVDLDGGRVETIAQLPGFTRGLAIVGRTAFVALSQIRESSVFGDLPLTDRLRERQCGVWAVDLQDGSVEGFLRFEDLVQEIFDVVLVPGARNPEIAEPGSAAVATSYALP